MSELLNEELEVLVEEDNVDIQTMMDALSFDEENKRILKQDKRISIPKEYTKTEVFDVAVSEAYAVANAFKILMDAGIDYSNAVSIASNSIVGYDNRQLQMIASIED